MNQMLGVGGQYEGWVERMLGERVMKVRYKGKGQANSGERIWDGWKETKGVQTKMHKGT